MLPGVTTFENHQLRQTEERLSKISGNTPLFNTVANTGDKAVQKKAKVTDKDQPLSWGQDPPGGASSWGGVVSQWTQFAVNNHQGLTPGSMLCMLSWFFVDWKLEKEMATHSSILAWRIPWTEGLLADYSPWGWEESDPTE